MNQAIASNVRTLREHRCWTQEHLADAAQVTVRTVQRVERGEGANKETLQAIAGALNVEIDLLRFDTLAHLASLYGVSREDVTPQLIAQRQKEAEAKYTKLPMTRLASSADLQMVSEAMSCYFDCIIEDDEVQNVAAAFQQDLTDLMDIGREIGAMNRRQFEVSVFEHVEELKALGAVVTIGTRRHSMKVANQEPIPWVSLYVVISSADDPKDVLLVEKSQRVRLG